MKKTMTKYALVIAITAKGYALVMSVAAIIMSFFTVYYISEEGTGDGWAFMLIALSLALIAKTALAHVLALVFKEIHRDGKEDGTEVSE